MNNLSRKFCNCCRARNTGGKPQ